MPEITNKDFEAALADVNNSRIIAKVCGKFRGQVSNDELTYRGYIALFHCLRKHDPSKSNKFTTSLYWHTLRQCQNAVRAEKRHPPHLALPNDYEASSPGVDILSVRECVEMLPDEHRRIIINYFFDGMTLEEIGEINGYGHVTAMNHLNKAKEAFRRLYRDD